MATHVAGGVDAFNSYVYAQPSQQDIEFFNRNNQTFYETIGQTGMAFFDGVRDRMQTIDFGRLQEYAQAAMRRVSSFWDTDTIRPLTTLADVQFPPDMMIRWQMANPDVRTMYHKKLCAGYDDKYVDFQPGVSRHEHHDYQRVMHGMEQYDEEGELCFVMYDETFEQEEDSVDYLSMSERCDIIQSWNTTTAFLNRMKDDPTSQFSGML